MSEPFYIKEATAPVVPIILSIPHSGTEFPDEIKDDYLPEQLASLDDTDWFLQDLYDFAPAMGITIVHAKYSRWAIDLNRDPKSAPLYNDGRLITGLCSSTDFLGNQLYKEGRIPDEKEQERRLEKYYWPYYQMVTNLLAQRKEQFGEALLWDAHSIREKVLTIRPTSFPEMILGNVDGKSSRNDLIKNTLKTLSSTFSVSHNDPFKGGHITRYFGDPSNKIHALQLERNKNLYMDDSETKYDAERAAKMQLVLKQNFIELIDILS